MATKTTKNSTSISDLTMFSLDYQCAILKMFIDDSDFSIATIDTMDQNHFTASPELRRIAGIIKEKTLKFKRTISYDELELYVKQDIQDKITVENIMELINKKMKGCRFGFTELDGIKKVYHEFLVTMESVRLTKELSELGKNGKFSKDDVAMIYAKYDKRTTFSEVTAKKPDFSPDNFAYLISDDTYECVATGCKPLDERLGGGLRKGDVGIFMAGTGIGKTCVTSGFVTYAALHGNKVAHIILEDKPNDILKKYIGYSLNIGVNDFKRNIDELNSRYYSDKGQEAMRLISENVRQISAIDSKKRVHPFNTLIIDQELTKLENSGFFPDMVVVDYFDRIKPIYQRSDIWVKDAEISDELNNIATSHNVALWVPSQGNKQVQDRSTRLNISNMTGGAWKGFTVQIVVAMQKFVDDMSGPNSTINILKNRYNNNFTPIGIEFFNGTCRFGRELTDTDAIYGEVEANSARIADIVFDANKGN